jgi:hypothetical protein
MEIGGVTTASEFHYIQNKAMLRKTDWLHKETRLNIADEECHSLDITPLVKEQVDFCRRLQAECNEFQYGKAAMCFLGDFLSTETIIKGIDIQSGSFWNILRAISQLYLIRWALIATRTVSVLQRIMPKMHNEGYQRQIMQNLEFKSYRREQRENAGRRIPYIHNAKRCGASISMFSDRISRNTTLIALPITITFQPLSSNRKHFGVR